MADGHSKIQLLQEELEKYQKSEIWR
jgi:hypothetical protein